MILLIGGSGILGQELIRLNSSIIAPTHDELNIDNIDVISKLSLYNPEVIILCAALKKGKPQSLVKTNIIGTSFVALYCMQSCCRLVYISTDYVYPGLTGNYKVHDNLNPVNFYAWTKLAGEVAVRGVKNHLIIRTSFYPRNFPYKTAFIDKFTSKDYCDIIAKKIEKVALNKNIQGIINIGTQTKSEYELAIRRHKDIDASVMPKDFLPKDSSMELYDEI